MFQLKIQRTLKMLYVLLIVLFCLSSCSTNTPMIGSGNVQYGDTSAVEAINTDFGSTDLNNIAQEISDRLIASNKLNQCKTYTVSQIRNKTDQYIDVEAITQSISTNLSSNPNVKSNYVLSSAEMQSQQSELDRQSSDLYQSSARAKKGRMIGAECRLDGFISTITKQNKDIKDVFYVFNFKLINTEAGIQLFATDKQIRKTMSR